MAIAFDLSGPDDILIRIYDRSGTEVTTLAHRNFPAGRHVFRWDGLNSSGQSVSAGLYRVRIKGTQINEIRKILVFR